MGNISSSFKHLFTPSNTSASYYNNMKTDIVGLEGKNNAYWMSTGYWETADNYNDACQALAFLLSEKAKLHNGDRLLDVGCGCGEQDFYWERLFPGVTIKALDITLLHIEIAARRAEELGSKINFSVGDACKLDFSSNTFSKVFALDCAFHFNSREDFFREAYRVLETGGIMAVSDMLPIKGEKFNTRGQLKRREGLFLPNVNMYDIKSYTDILENIGFKNINVTHLERPVYGGMARYYVSRYLHPKRPINELKIQFSRRLWGKLSRKIFHCFYGTSDYVMVTACKS